MGGSRGLAGSPLLLLGLRACPPVAAAAAASGLSILALLLTGLVTLALLPGLSGGMRAPSGIARSPLYAVSVQWMGVLVAGLMTPFLLWHLQGHGAWLAYHA